MFRLPIILEKAMDTLKKEGISSFLYKTKRKFIYLYQHFTFRPYIITKSLAGEEIQLLISDLFAEGWYAQHPVWPELVWLKENLLEKGDLVADCGANNGYTGIFFSKYVGDTGKVIGFEALPANAKVALENTKLNNIKNFEVKNTAVGSHKGVIKFIVHPNGSVGEQYGMESIEVPLVTLDEVFESEKPTFLKIDVEGYEIEVLKGAQQILKTRPKLDVEIHCSSYTDTDRSSQVAQLLNLLQLSDYQAHIQLLEDGEIIPYNPIEHTPEFIAKFDNVHLFAKPISC